MSDQKNILVFKLSALGDFVQNFGIMRAIRQHHTGSHVTLLTTKPYAELGKLSGYFDDVIIDTRPKFYQLGAWSQLRKKLNEGQFDIVYDLQNNDRTRLYYKLFNKAIPVRVGLNKEDDKNNLAFDRHAAMLKNAGISEIKIDSMGWMKADMDVFDLPKTYALIVPGCAPTRPEKRWPVERFIDVCRYLVNHSITPVILGTKDEIDITNQIAKECPKAIDLNGKTKLTDIPALARGAVMAIGNDTGPMHMIGPTGCKTLALFSGYSDPVRHRPLGENVSTIQEPELKDLSTARVIQSISL